MNTQTTTNSKTESVGCKLARVNDALTNSSCADFRHRTTPRCNAGQPSL